MFNAQFLPDCVRRQVKYSMFNMYTIEKNTSHFFELSIEY